MSFHSFDLQTILYSTLNGDSTLDGIVGNNKIFDHVPQDTSYPYVVLGNITTNNRGTKTVDGNEYKNLYQCLASSNKKTGNPSEYFRSIKTGERFGSYKQMLEHLLS